MGNLIRDLKSLLIEEPYQFIPSELRDSTETDFWMVVTGPTSNLKLRADLRMTSNKFESCGLGLWKGTYENLQYKTEADVLYTILENTNLASTLAKHLESRYSNLMEWSSSVFHLTQTLLRVIRKELGLLSDVEWVTLVFALNPGYSFGGELSIKVKSEYKAELVGREGEKSVKKVLEEKLTEFGLWGMEYGDLKGEGFVFSINLAQEELELVDAVLSISFL